MEKVVEKGLSIILRVRAALYSQTSIKSKKTKFQIMNLNRK